MIEVISNVYNDGELQTTIPNNHKVKVSEIVELKKNDIESLAAVVHQIETYPQVSMLIMNVNPDTFSEEVVKQLKEYKFLEGKKLYVT